MKTPETIGQRIKLVRGELSQKAFGVRIGLSQTAVTALETDQSEPRLGTFNSIVEAFGINPEWLRTGGGQMKGGTPADQLPPQVPSELKPPQAPQMPVPGEATPQQADFVGRLIKRLETELAQAQAREEYLQGLVTELLGKSVDSSDAAGQQLFTSFLTPVRSVPISLAPAPTRQAREMEYAIADTCRHIFVSKWGENPQAKEVAA